MSGSARTARAAKPGILERIGSAWNAFRGSGPGHGRPSDGTRFVHPSMRAYAGGAPNPRDPDFDPPLSGPNSLAATHLPRLRRRCRYLCATHPNLAGAVTTLVNNVIGTGFYPKPLTGDDATDKALADLWWEHCEGVDPDRRLSHAQSAEMAVREMAAVGEFFADFAVAPAWRGRPEAPAIQLIDTDRLPFDDYPFGVRYRAEPAAGNTVRQGVEKDDLGRVAAYHVLTEHPADGVYAPAVETARLTAERASLGFVAQRVGQLRGIPWAVAVVQDARMEHAYHEANILLAQAAAFVGLYFKGVRPPGAGAGEVTDAAVDAFGRDIAEMYAGQVGYLPRDGDLEVKGGTQPGPTFPNTMAVLQQRMAAGLGIGYAVFARDPSKNNFASQRAEALEDRRNYRRLQALIWHTHTRPYWESLVNWAVISGKVTLKGKALERYRRDPRSVYACSVVFAGWEWVNPQQEANADQVALAIGATSRQQIAMGRGRNAFDLLDEELELEVYERRRREQLGLPPKESPASMAGGRPGQRPERPGQEAPDTESPDGEDQDREDRDREDQSDEGSGSSGGSGGDKNGDHA